MAVARRCDRLEDHLYAAALGVDHAAVNLARGGERLEQRLYLAVLGVGRANLAVGRWVRGGDERGIDGLIFALVAGVRALGARARTLQSGLIHHSLAISAVAIAVLLAILFSASLSF
tara:strand:- start:1707 stop:2057 length:351 start_codon:yes stop_codon:yes gene_type:complete